MPRPVASTVHELQVPPTEAGQRIDVWLAARLPLSRARIQQLIAAGLVTADGVALSSPSRKTRAGMQLRIEEPPSETAEVLPQQIPLTVVFEDEHLLAIDKAAGIVVHPAPGHADGTLVNALLHHCDELAETDDAGRPGIVHRLDRDTTGIMVVAKTPAALASIAAQFKNDTVGKFYHALVHGLPQPPEQRLESAIGRHPRHRLRMAVLSEGGRRAVSHYRVCETFAEAEAALVEVRIETGRTHQIRVHLRHAGYPVIGDPLYGRRRRDVALGLNVGRQFLHASRLVLNHPATGKELVLEAPLPLSFKEARQHLRQFQPG